MLGALTLGLDRLDKMRARMSTDVSPDFPHGMGEK